MILKYNIVAKFQEKVFILKRFILKLLWTKLYEVVAQNLNFINNLSCGDRNADRIDVK